MQLYKGNAVSLKGNSVTALSAARGDEAATVMPLL